MQLLYISLVKAFMLINKHNSYGCMMFFTNPSSNHITVDVLKVMSTCQLLFIIYVVLDGLNRIRNSFHSFTIFHFASNSTNHILSRYLLTNFSFVHNQVKYFLINSKILLNDSYESYDTSREQQYSPRLAKEP